MESDYSKFFQKEKFERNRICDSDRIQNNRKSVRKKENEKREKQLKKKERKRKEKFKQNMAQFPSAIGWRKKKLQL